MALLQFGREAVRLLLDARPLCVTASISSAATLGCCGHRHDRDPFVFTGDGRGAHPHRKIKILKRGRNDPNGA